jgi:hypothetical protein
MSGEPFQIAAAPGKLANRLLGVADVEQHHGLHVVDVSNAKPFQFQLEDFEELSMQALYNRNGFQVLIRHYLSPHKRRSRNLNEKPHTSKSIYSNFMRSRTSPYRGAPFCQVFVPTPP